MRNRPGDRPVGGWFLIPLGCVLVVGLAACKDDGGAPACTTSADCSGGTPHCNPDTGTCVECLGPTDCPTGYACTSNHCVDTADPYGEARVICIEKINELRATKGLPPYVRWTAAEYCADGQATADETSGSAHGTFGDCGEHAQNECLGSGVAGIEGCLDMMWAEKDQAGCSGCDACNDAYTPDCADCDFYGSQTGDVCGHYVNMSALYLTEAACGFSDLGGWATIDFR